MKKYKKGVIFEGNARIEALIKVLQKPETIIYLVAEEEISDDSSTVTLKIHYK